MVRGKVRMSEEAFRQARAKIHHLYQDDAFDFWTMCALFDSLNDIENSQSSGETTNE